jgi:hypothetical protein
LVYNGNALDSFGRHLNKEDQVDDSELHVIGTDATYFVEIEFVEEESDPDDRGFWDPTFVNPPPDLDGKEFSLEVKTRLKPLWRVHTPISTVAFDVEANPESTRIPLMVLVVDGGIIDDAMMPGANLVEVAGVLEEDVSAGTEIKLLNSRLFPGLTNPPSTVDVGVGTANVEVGLTINTNDRDKGVIDLGAALGNSHKAGDIVRLTSGNTTFVEQRTDAIPDVLTHPDVAERLFQGNEFRGQALTSSKEVQGDRDDLNIASLKDEVDALSALIHEMKFGARRPDELGTLEDDHDRLPPHVVTTPRYWDHAGSIMGARTATLTIGDGVKTFGDFNGADHFPFQDAVDNLPAEGGTIFIKGGDYTFGAEVNYSNKSVNWIGESRSLVKIEFLSNGQAIFDATNAATTLFQDLTITKFGTNQRSLRLTDVQDARVERCTIVGEIFSQSSGGDLPSFVFSDSTIFAQEQVDRRALRIEDTARLRVDNSFVVGEIQYVSPSSGSFVGLNSTFQATEVDNSSAFLGQGGSYSFAATNCIFKPADGFAVPPGCPPAPLPAVGQKIISFETPVTSGLIDNCLMTVRDGVLLSADAGVDCFGVKRCKITTLEGGAIVKWDINTFYTSIAFDGIEISNPAAFFLDVLQHTDYFLFGSLFDCSFKNIRVVDELLVTDPLLHSFMRFGDDDHAELVGSVSFEDVKVRYDASGGLGVHCVGADGQSGNYDLSFRHCLFQGCSTGVTCRKSGNLTVDDCIFVGEAKSTHGVVCGTRVFSGFQEVVVQNSYFKRIHGVAGSDVHGISIVGADVDLGGEFGSTIQVDMRASLTVKNNTFEQLGDITHGGVLVTGIFAEANTRLQHALISGNEFDRLDSGPASTLRSVLLRGFDMQGVPGAASGTHIFDNNFHLQGNDAPDLNNGFVDIQRVGTNNVTNCKIHDNTMDTLLSAEDGLFAIQVQASINLTGVSICRNTIKSIGQAASDETGSSGVIHVRAAVMIDLVVADNTISQLNFSSIPGIRIRPETGSINMVVSNNTILCSIRSWNPVYIGTANVGAFTGTSILGNVVDFHSQTWATLTDASIRLEAQTLNNTVVSNNSLTETVFEPLRSSLIVKSTNGGTGLVCSGNVTQMPDPGAGFTRPQAWLLDRVNRFMVTGNIVQCTLPTEVSAVPLGVSGGIVLGGAMDFGLISSNYVTPSAGAPSNAIVFVGTSIVALANLTGTVGAGGLIASGAAVGQRLQSDLSPAGVIDGPLGTTNVFDTTIV